ncbi:MAG: thiamine pyrophosphate-binding protein [Chloroflexi bacterium]|nr:thiamine pyrophosphate-binding protein [Chloroflexota bacterium]
MIGADLLVQALQRRGVSLVFTLSGNGLNPFYVACRRAGIRLVDFRNEQAASLAADALARLTGQLAVCAVSSAVGHANALIGLVNAWFDGAPVLLISGASEHARTGQGKFQDLDHLPLVASLCKYAWLVDRPERIPFHLHEACARATSGRPGPVHLTVPVDVLSAEVAPNPRDDVRPVGAAHCRVAADPAASQEAAEVLSRAERPVIVAGSGVFSARAEDALERLAAEMAIPVVVPIWDRGCVPRPAPHFLGVVGAASGGPNMLPDADAVVIVGARVDYRIGYGEAPVIQPGARIVRIDVDPVELRQGVEPDVAILADARSALVALRTELCQRRTPPWTQWLDEARRRDAEFRRRWASPPSGVATGHHLVEALRPYLTDEAIFLVDGGNIGQWAHMVLADRYPGHWLTCGASGLVGWGMAGAIAARLAHPDRPVILLSGDGALGFGIVELETAVRHNLPFVAVVADDCAWGIVVSGQQSQYGPEGVIASRLGPVRYDLVAEGLGALGLGVGRPEEIAPAVARGLASGRPTLIQVPIEGGGPAD